MKRVRYILTLSLLGLPAVAPSRASTGGDVVYLRGIHYDAENQVYAYTLPTRALVRVRYGVKRGCCLYTPVDWQIQDAGKHEIPFDFRVAGKVPSQLDGAQIRATALTCALPEDLRETRASSVQAFRELSRRSRGQREASARADPRVRSVSPFWRKGLAKEPEFQVEFVGAKKLGHERYRLSERAEVKLVVDKSNRERFTQTVRGEVVIHVDFKFFAEEEFFDPDKPFTIDLSRISPGEHVITFNLRDPGDNIGARSYMFVK